MLKRKYMKKIYIFSSEEKIKQVFVIKIGITGKGAWLP